MNIPIYILGALVFCWLGARHAAVVERRLRKTLGLPLFLAAAAAWPLSVLGWISACLLARRLLSSPFEFGTKLSRLAAEKVENETRRDWEERVDFWLGEGQRAEKEDDQALRWLVADNLSFLLTTRPAGAQTWEERAKTETTRRKLRVAKAKAAAELDRVYPGTAAPERSTYIKPVRLDPPSPVDTTARICRDVTSVNWADLRAQFDEKVRKAPVGAPPKAQWTFCKICSRKAMEGICDVCADDQGLR